MHIVTNIRPFDAAEFLDNTEDEASLLNSAVEDGSPAFIAAALGAVARAHGGIDRLAADTGLSRQSLYKALSENGNPTLKTVLKVLDALGLQMHIERKEPEREFA